MPTLRVQIPEKAEAIYVLTGNCVTVGRRPDNTVQILDRSVSAHHAQFVFEEGHYRLHDLQSTNLTQVDGAQVADFHLHAPCRLVFGSVECAYDPTPNLQVVSAETPLTPAQLEKDLAFLRADNQELLNKVDSLQRRIDILSSARLVSKSEQLGGSSSADVKKASEARDELRFQNSGLKLELERLRDELGTTARERDQARRAYELLQAERSALQDELHALDKGATQRIAIPLAAGAKDPWAAQRA